MPRFTGLGLIVAAIVTSTALFLATSQAAETYTVTRTDDPVQDGCGTNGCSLREAVTAANSGGGVVEAGVGAITLTGGTISITGSVEVQGDGVDQTIVNGGGSRAFTVEAAAEATIANLKVTGGDESTGCGGGVSNAGDLTLTNAEISGNQMSGQGGGFCNTGTATLTDVVIVDNQATHNLAGGGVWNSGTLTARHTEITGNAGIGVTGGGDGAGVYNSGEVLMDYVVIGDNSGSSSNCDDCSSGAGVYNTGSAELHYTSIENNHSDTMAGFENRGAASINNSAIVNNTAGSVFNDREKVMTITNTTISGNSGGPYPDVGTAALTNYGSLILQEVTMVNNPASWIKYGSLQNFGAVQISNTILANNGQDNCNTGGTITSSNGNMTDDATCNLSGSKDKVGDPMVGPLADNGGPTLTHALDPGSPAIDGGVNSKCSSPDQRKAPRPVGGTCDIGAYESGGIVPTATPSPSPTPAPVAFPMGDTNCNDRIDAGDITAELRLVSDLDEPDDCGRETLPCIQSGNACYPQWTDTDCDGDIDALDAAPVLMHLVGSPVQHDGCVVVGEMPDGGG